MKRRLRAIAVGYGVIVLWMFLPMIPVVIASVIASACGCELNEADAHPCIVFGRDIGGVLYKMAMIGWFGLLTFPTGILALIQFTVQIVRGTYSED
jgi:hypothetical protein